ncbi:serine hydrolase domain-containing protein [Streptomyces sp. 549]|uniref:serine hydrolase domain-containing protein n=1 Tax=Streptomyces sp. 549 TaxID=3049076 RepID=UPI0024C3FDD0|nr:serine hydrolase domain-containing protein [Streptomyces sp. 549]MDK1472664.1 serine hydrolase domain-containing protein [Streptomyces sp. 549]
MRERLADAVRSVDAPDVVFAWSRDGERVVCSGGTAPRPPVGRDRLRYEIGSAGKTFTGLLLADLVRSGEVRWLDPAAAFLAPDLAPGRRPVSLLHLVTHTSGLPRLPADFYPQALPRWTGNPYARYSAARVVAAFLRGHRRHRPGSRWRYSNFGVSVLGHSLAAATGTPWADLLDARVLTPLGLAGTATRPAGGHRDAVGHGRDGRTPVPPLLMGGFEPAGAMRATPHDLLRYLEAHLGPAGTPLADALRTVRRPVLRRGPGHRHVHTATWFQEDTERGPMLFHSGATCGQQAYLGFRPATGTAVAAVCTRRFRLSDPFLPAACALLADPAL